MRTLTEKELKNTVIYVLEEHQSQICLTDSEANSLANDMVRQILSLQLSDVEISTTIEDAHTAKETGYWFVVMVVLFIALVLLITWAIVS